MIDCETQRDDGKRRVCVDGGVGWGGGGVGRWGEWVVECRRCPTSCAHERGPGALHGAPTPGENEKAMPLLKPFSPAARAFSWSFMIFSMTNMTLGESMLPSSPSTAHEYLACSSVRPSPFWLSSMMRRPPGCTAQKSRSVFLRLCFERNESTKPAMFLAMYCGRYLESVHEMPFSVPSISQPCVSKMVNVPLGARPGAKPWIT